MFAGQPLTKQVSHSLITPSNILEYNRFFKQSSNREDGWADVKIDRETTWRRMWFVFDDSVLKYGPGPHAPESSFVPIPMDNVMSLRADNSHGTIQITTDAHKFHLRLENQAEMNRWLFCFQKTVALVLTHLTQAAEQQAYNKGTSQRIDADQERSPYGNPRVALESPYRGGSGKNPAHNYSFGGASESTAAVLEQDEVRAAFRRNDERHAGRDETRRASLHGLPSDSDSRFDFRHSSSSAIPIGPPSGGAGGGDHHHHRHRAQSHHASHSHAMTHSQQAQSHHSHYSHGRTRSTSGGERASTSSTDRLATSFKEDDDEHLRLEELLQTPSDGHRSRADSEEECNSNSSQEGDADWRSRGSNELQDDDEDELMFDLDETADMRNSCVSESKPLSHHGQSSTPHTRNHSTESTGQDSFYSVGKALSLSLTLADPDHKSPSRRSSHANMTAASTAAMATASNTNANRGSPQPVPATQGLTSSTSYGNMSRANHSDYLMWESGFCSRKGIRETQEDRFSCLPNINDHLRSGGAGVPSSSGATSATSPASSNVTGVGANSPNTLPAGVTSPASALSSVFASVNAAQATPLVSVGGLGGGVEAAGGYFGVYDGHGGQAAAIYLEKYLFGNICQHPQFHGDLAFAVNESCKRTDKDFLSECDGKKLYCGTTALGAFVLGSQLMVFSIGDCQAVLCSNGIAVELNDPHKPGREDESARIVKAGGWITEERELFFGRMHRMDLSDPLVRDKAKQVTTWATIHRVCGEISVSRSIGDPEYKRFTPGATVNAFFSWPPDHKMVFEADLLIPDPECRAHTIQEEDEFLVLASDGLWDVVSPQDTVTMVKEAFELNKSPTQAAEDLCELAVKLGSNDNVTVVITRFMHSV